MNTAYIFIPWLSQWKRPITLFHNEFMVGLFDYVALIVAVVLLVFYLISFFRDAKYFSRIDPPKPNKHNEER